MWYQEKRRIGLLLMNAIWKQITSISRAGYPRKKEVRREEEKRTFPTNPYGFAKSLFEQSKGEWRIS